MPSIPTLPQTSIPPYVGVYEMTDGQINNLMAKANQMSVDESLQSFLLNTTPYDGIDTIIQVPDGFSNWGDTLSNTNELNSGMWTFYDTTTIGKKHSKRFASSDSFVLDIPVPFTGAYDNYMDYPPYTKMKLHVPFVGFIDIDPSYVYNCVLRLEYVIDYCTGRGIAFVHSQYYTGSPSVLVAEIECNFANSIPFSVAKGNAFTGAIKNLFGNIGNGLNMIGEMLQVSEQTNRGTITDSGIISDLRAYIEVTRVANPTNDSSRASLYGLPNNAIIKLSSTTGYIQITEIHTDGIDATDEEKIEIESLLKSGVYVKGWS